MTSFALSLGCALLAFSPTLSLLLLFAYSKAQLVIIVTTSSFAHLLSCLLAALLHLPFKGLSTGTQAIFIILPTSILAQAICRCGFVYLYHKVEGVIETSIAQHERQHTNYGNGNRNSNNDNNNDDNEPIISETAQLRLELNDASAGIASGVGFGFFHTVMLYGTLLASENSRVGTLYQNSCTFMPSVFNSAIMAFFFGILDIVWMLLTFYGMRRCRTNNNDATSTSAPQWQVFPGAVGGKAALALVLVTHFAAAFATVPNQTFAVNGCVIAIPSLAGVTLATMAMFWYLIQASSFLPDNQKMLRIRMENHAIASANANASGSGVNGSSNGYID